MELESWNTVECGGIGHVSRGHRDGEMYQVSSLSSANILQLFPFPEDPPYPPPALQLRVLSGDVGVITGNTPRANGKV
jgi:hypothetical protein